MATVRVGIPARKGEKSREREKVRAPLPFRSIDLDEEDPVEESDDPIPGEPESHDDAHIDAYEDEDFDEGNRLQYLGELFEGHDLAHEKRRWRKPRIALVEFDRQLVTVVQNFRLSQSRYATTPIATHLKLLKALGEKIAEEFSSEIKNQCRGSRRRLRQKELASALAGSLGLKESTLEGRISRLVKRGCLELPDGRVVPLAEFISTERGRPKQHELNQRLKEYIKRYKGQENRRIAEEFVKADSGLNCLVGQKREKTIEAIRKRIARLKEASKQKSKKRGA